MQQNNFVNVFKDALTRIQADAAAVGINLTSICRDPGISRATPDRWLRKPPKTILLIAEMQEKITDRQAAIAADDVVRSKKVPGAPVVK